MNEILKAYAAFSLDDELRLASSSGALVPSFANFIVANGGVVYGVAMSDDCYSATFKRVHEQSGLKELRGSKYLQAKVGDTFIHVKDDLDKGKKVLFTGTGCQVNGLKMFLGKEYENLICIDIVCHGTPSPKLWREYVKFREKQYNARLVYVSFRNKEKHGWDRFEMKEICSNKIEVYISRHIDPYFRLFVSNLALRPSCFECTAKFYKTSDLTVGDFWGIDEVAPEMNDDKGISLVLVRTSKGERIFDIIKENLSIKEVTYGQGVAHNMAEYKSYDKPEKRDIFFHDLELMSFEKLYRHYKKYTEELPLWRRIGRKGKALLKLICRGGGKSKTNK